LGRSAAPTTTRTTRRPDATPSGIRPTWSPAAAVASLDLGGRPGPQVAGRLGRPISKRPEELPIRLVRGGIGAALEATGEMALQPRCIGGLDGFDEPGSDERAGPVMGRLGVVVAAAEGQGHPPRPRPWA
jgi:hypothetical protein